MYELTRITGQLSLVLTCAMMLVAIVRMRPADTFGLGMLFGIILGLTMTGAMVLALGLECR